MVNVAQLVESRIVIPVVVGSIPIIHPNVYGEVSVVVRTAVCETARMISNIILLPRLYVVGSLMVKLFAVNEKDVGSNPILPTNFLKGESEMLRGTQIISGKRALEYSKMIELFRGCLHC